MDAIGYLFDAVVYFLITVSAVTAAVWRVDEKVAMPGTSPWRMRLPKLCVIVGPMLFVLAGAITLTGTPAWLPATPLIGSLAAPWIGAVLITVEWLRRRAEDRATGLVRPLQVSTWVSLRKST